MKLTEAKRKWILNKISLYCSLLKCVIPNVFFTMAEYNRWKEKQRIQTGRHRVGRLQCLGVCHRQDNFIVILPKRLKNTKELDHIIRHELIHWAKPSYNHWSKEFNNRMQKLKKGKLDKNGRFLRR